MLCIFQFLLCCRPPLPRLTSLGSSVLGTEDDLAVSLRFMNFGGSPPSSDEDSGLSSFVENPQYFCGIIKDKDMCECDECNSCYPDKLTVTMMTFDNRLYISC